MIFPVTFNYSRQVWQTIHLAGADAYFLDKFFEATTYLELFHQIKRHVLDPDNHDHFAKMAQRFHDGVKGEWELRRSKSASDIEKVIYHQNATRRAYKRFHFRSEMKYSSGYVRRNHVTSCQVLTDTLPEFRRPEIRLPGSITVTQVCQRKRRTVEIDREGTFIIHDHEGEDLAKSRLAEQLGGKPCKCETAEWQYRAILNGGNIYERGHAKVNSTADHIYQLHRLAGLWDADE